MNQYNIVFPEVNTFIWTPGIEIWPNWSTTDYKPSLRLLVVLRGFKCTIRTLNRMLRSDNPGTSVLAIHINDNLQQLPMSQSLVARSKQDVPTLYMR